jgi:hypothetical protein
LIRAWVIATHGESIGWEKIESRGGFMAAVEKPPGGAVSDILAVPLSMSQLNAARDLYESSTKLAGWRLADRSLSELRDRFPDFDRISVLLKTVAVNTLYSTNVFAVQRMTEHVVNVVSKTSLNTAGAELVEELSKMEEGGRAHRSFASKFCRFFVDHERFPTWDSFAITMVGVHLGLDFEPKSYLVFLEHLQKLKLLWEFDCSNPELDRYLWLAGQLRAFKENPTAKINTETQWLFREPSIEERGLLRRLERDSVMSGRADE